MDAARRQYRQERVELAISDERLPTDDRNVQGTVTIGQRDHAID
jgi:hypothetical protein